MNLFPAFLAQCLFVTFILSSGYVLALPMNPKSKKPRVIPTMVQEQDPTYAMVALNSEEGYWQESDENPSMPSDGSGDDQPRVDLPARSGDPRAAVKGFGLAGKASLQASLDRLNSLSQELNDGIKILDKQLADGNDADAATVADSTDALKDATDDVKRAQAKLDMLQTAALRQ